MIHGHLPADVMAYVALVALAVLTAAWLYGLAAPVVRGWRYHRAGLHDAKALPHGHHAKPPSRPLPVLCLRHVRRATA